VSPPTARRRDTAAQALRLCVGTLTVVRIRPPTRVDGAIAGAAMALAPLVALVPATAVAVVCATGTALTAPPLLTAVGAVAVLALMSRGLHLDGLADTADGLASGHDRDRALAVMRTGDVGPVGAATLCLALLAQVVAVASMVEDARLVSALLPGLAVVVSRGMLPIACAAGVPAARGDGLGAAVAGSVGRVTAVLVPLLLAAPAAVVAVLAGLAWWTGPVAVVASLAATAAVVARCVQRLGGVTGDVLGAVVELSLVAAAAALAIAV
jgi:adenosylcobinamide-GDP ribazoletransferase